MGDPELRVRERLISEIEPLVLQRKPILLQPAAELCLDPLTTPRCIKAAVL